MTAQSLIARRPVTDFVIYQPIPGADDGAGISAALIRAAGKRLVIQPSRTTSTIAIATPIQVPSKSDIWIDSSCVFASTMANTGPGGFTNSVFFATKTGVSATIALSADAVFGTNTLVVATNPATIGVAKGSRIALQYSLGGNQLQTFTVLSVTGTGPYTLTLDDNTLFPYWTVANGANIYTYTPPLQIRIWGNQAKIYGTGDRACEFAFARDVKVDGLVVDHTLGPAINGFREIQFSWDVGCADCVGTNCRADGGSGYLSGQTGHAGFAIEGSNRCTWRDCESANFGQAAPAGSGFSIFDSLNSTLDNPSAINCFQGYYIGSNDANGTAGSRGINLIAPAAVNNSSIGIFVDKQSSVTATGWYDWGNASSLNMPVAGSVVVVQGFFWTAKPVGSWTGFSGTAGDLTLWGGTVDLTRTDATNKNFCDLGSGLTGTFRLDFVRTIAGQNGLYMEDATAHRVIRGFACDFSSCSANPIRKGSTSKTNFGTLTANGITNVVVTAACTAQDTVMVTQTSGVPTTGLELVSIGADTFTVVGLAGNTNTYKWWIVPGGA